MAGKQSEHLEEATHARQQQLQGVSTQPITLLFGSWISEMTSADWDIVETMMMDNGFATDTDLTPYTVPPGEEGLDLSYEGGEHEAFDGLSEQIVSLSGL
jgi:hypothetical protein